MGTTNTVLEGCMVASPVFKGDCCIQSKACKYCSIVCNFVSELWESYGVLPVGHEWVLECIGRFQIIPIWPFLTCAVSEDQVRTLGFPEDALANDYDDDDETVVESQV
jgi:hypothetical protein